MSEFAFEFGDRPIQVEVSRTPQLPLIEILLTRVIKWFVKLWVDQKIGEPPWRDGDNDISARMGTATSRHTSVAAVLHEVGTPVPCNSAGLVPALPAVRFLLRQRHNRIAVWAHPGLNAAIHTCGIIQIKRVRTGAGERSHVITLRSGQRFSEFSPHSGM